MEAHRYLKVLPPRAPLAGLSKSFDVADSTSQFEERSHFVRGTDGVCLQPLARTLDGAKSPAPVSSAPVLCEAPQTPRVVPGRGRSRRRTQG